MRGRSPVGEESPSAAFLASLSAFSFPLTSLWAAIYLNLSLCCQVSKSSPHVSFSARLVNFFTRW
jgi:hypothetical protein